MKKQLCLIIISYLIIQLIYGQSNTYPYPSSSSIGIGTTSPGYYKLAVSSSDFRVASFNSTYGQMNVDFMNSGVLFSSIGSGVSQTADAGITQNDFGIGTAGSSTNRILFATGAAYNVRMLIDANGNIGIGTTSPSDKLSVNGNIVANGFIKTPKLIVTQTGWSDYVFSNGYKLRSLLSLEAFIKQNKHLPEIPSAKDIQEKGISVGDNQAMLLKKIEELTLYVIQLQKQLDSQTKEIKKLKQK